MNCVKVFRVGFRVFFFFKGKTDYSFNILATYEAVTKEQKVNQYIATLSKKRKSTYTNYPLWDV